MASPYVRPFSPQINILDETLSVSLPYYKTFEFTKYRDVGFFFTRVVIVEHLYMLV